MADNRGGTKIGGYIAAHLGNLKQLIQKIDGHGSGIEADTIDGIEGSDIGRLSQWNTWAGRNSVVTNDTWIAGMFGSTRAGNANTASSNKVIMGSLSDYATIGAHNSALTTWAQLNLNFDPTSPATGGKTYISQPYDSNGNAILTTAGGTITGPLVGRASSAAINVNTQGTPSFEVKGTDGATHAAYMTFHRPGTYAVRFGLDTDNKLKIGGWSMGNVAYEMWHAGNFDPGSKLSTTGGDLSGQLNIISASPTIYLKDTDATDGNDFWIHTNSNRFYILSDRNNDGSWDGAAPLDLNSATNTASVFGNTIWHTGNLTFGTGNTNMATGDHAHDTRYLRADTSSTLTGKNYIGITTTGSNGTHATNRVVVTSGNAISGGTDTCGQLDANVRIHSWYSVGFTPSISGQTVAQGENAVWINVRTGEIFAQGEMYAKTDKVVWHAGNHNHTTEKSYNLPATAGWYRIAASGVGIERNSARFEIDWIISGSHGRVIFNAACMYGNADSATLNQVQFSSYDTAKGITKARIVYHTTYSGNYAYLEVYHPDALLTSIHIEMQNAIGWSTVYSTATTGSIPSGYSNVEITFDEGFVTEGQLISTIATGTSPLKVNSTTKVSNLNADLFDDMHVLRFVHGDNDTATIRVTDLNNLYRSQFFDATNGTNAPETGWVWGINISHGSDSSTVRYNGQIAIGNGTNKMYFRSTDVNGVGTWYQVWHSSNLAFGTGNTNMARGDHGHTAFSNSMTVQTTAAGGALIARELGSGYNDLTNAVIIADTQNPDGTKNHFFEGRLNGTRIMSIRADGVIGTKALWLTDSEVTPLKVERSGTNVNVNMSFKHSGGTTYLGLNGAAELCTGSSVDLNASGGKILHTNNVPITPTSVTGSLVTGSGNMLRGTDSNYSIVAGMNNLVHDRGAVFGESNVDYNGRGTFISGYANVSLGYTSSILGNANIIGRLPNMSNDVLNDAYVLIISSFNTTTKSIIINTGFGIPTKTLYPAGAIIYIVYYSNSPDPTIMPHKIFKTTIQSWNDAVSNELFVTALPSDISSIIGIVKEEDIYSTSRIATAIGCQNIISGGNGIAIGVGNKVAVASSIAIGKNNYIYSKSYASVIGLNLTVSNLSDGGLIVGKYGSVSDASTLFAIGNGTSTASTGLALKVQTNGGTFADSSYNSTGADYSEYFEWIDGNPDNEDRVGYFVTLDGEQIRKSNSTDDDILGIISSMPAIIGDNHEMRWKGKFLVDEWGRIQYKDVVIPAVTEEIMVPAKIEQQEILDTDGNSFDPPQFEDVILTPEHVETIITEQERTETQPILNPDWDPESEYVPRKDRKEWAAVGLVGKLYIRQDGTLKVNGYCKSNDEGIATACTKADGGYRVMKIISDEIAFVFVK